VPGSLSIISATYDDAERGRAIGTWSIQRDPDGDRPGHRGLADPHVSWRAAFFINVPLAYRSILVAALYGREQRSLANR
jgi:hypothetical protein